MSRSAQAQPQPEPREDERRSHLKILIAKGKEQG